APRRTSPPPRSSSHWRRAAGARQGDGAMPARSEFKVAVTKDNLVFASAHFITFPGHRCETLHGHNYRTRVVIEGGLDAEAHYVFDFSALKDLMKRLTDEIDHKVLLPTQNPKIAVREQGDSLTVAAAHAQPYEIQRDPTALGSLLARLAAEQGAAIGAAHAVTMTAELSQMFRTKREGVRFVLDAVTDAFPEPDVRVYAADGRFL